MREGRDNSGARCTGECCRRFHLSRTHEDGTIVRTETEDQLSDVLRPLLRLDEHIPAADGYPGFSWFVCRQWDAASGRCLAYDDRPEMCRTFPDVYCNACGARSSAEAAGVALMRV